jgi:hypothetical protein
MMSLSTTRAVIDDPKLVCLVADMAVLQTPSFASRPLVLRRLGGKKHTYILWSQMKSIAVFQRDGIRRGCVLSFSLMFLDFVGWRLFP